MELKIEYVDIDELVPYLNNAKIHTAEQIGQIKKSIEEFGMNDPIAVWKDNEIIEGHGRLIALKELGYNQAPIVRLDHLTDEQRKAYTLVHNKLTMNTNFDFDILGMELDNIVNIDMSDFGFDFEGFSEEDFGNDFELPDGDEPEMCTVSYTLHKEQKALIDYATSAVEKEIHETFGNTNKNGNAIYEVVRQWAEQRT